MPFASSVTKQLLTNSTGLDASEWVEVWPYEDLTIHFYGLVSGDTVVVEASNEDGDPANGVQFGSTITTNDFVVLNELPRKIRVRKTANAGGGSVNVIMHGRIPS